MTDKEIIKALECCLGGDGNKSQWEICSPCPYFDDGNCTDLLKENALELIKRQQEYIEEIEVIVGLQRKRKYYNRFVKEVWQKERGKLSYPDFDEIYKRYFEQQERFDRIVEQLKEWAESSKRLYFEYNDEECYGAWLAHNRAIEIVKAGGKNE